MEQKYKQVFIEVFGVLEGALNDDFSKDNVKEWDSVHQLNIVALLEEAFDVMFEPEDIMGFTSYKAGKKILKNTGRNLNTLKFMARWGDKNVRVTGVAAAVPRNVVYTTDFDFFTPEEGRVFNNTVGIKQRHIAPEDVCTSDLCFAAAEQLLADLKWERESVDILIFESVTGDYKTPPTSCLLQDRLGLSEDCFAMDIPMGCWLYVCDNDGRQFVIFG